MSAPVYTIYKKDIDQIVLNELTHHLSIKVKRPTFPDVFVVTWLVLNEDDEELICCDTKGVEFLRFDNSGMAYFNTIHLLFKLLHRKPNE
jgi:hypothetical protein